MDKHCAFGWFYENAQKEILQNKKMPVMNRDSLGGMVARLRSARSRTQTRLRAHHSRHTPAGDKATKPM